MRKNNNNNYRKYLKLAVLVCLTVFIGLGGFYIIGLIQQAITNYMEWNANGGFINSELIKPVDWDIWVCMGYAFSFSGLKLTLIVSVGIGCIVFLSCDNVYVGAILFSVAFLTVCIMKFSLFTGKHFIIPILLICIFHI